MNKRHSKAGQMWIREEREEREDPNGKYGSRRFINYDLKGVRNRRR